MLDTAFLEPSEVTRFNNFLFLFFSFYSLKGQSIFSTTGHYANLISAICVVMTSGCTLLF